MSGTGPTQSKQMLYKECRKIEEKLQKENPVEDVNAIQPNASSVGFSLLAQSLRESLERDEPHLALDRLHTFVVKYVRTLCDRHGITYSKETPLHRARN